MDILGYVLNVWIFGIIEKNVIYDNILKRKVVLCLKL